MQRKAKLCRAFLIGSLLSVLAGCLFDTDTPLPPMELNLYFGIPQVVRLNDNETQATSRSTIKPQRMELDGGTELLQQLNFTHYFNYKELGIRAYFRRGRVALIEVQEPFRGAIQGKRLELFPFSAPQGKNWEETLIREFGIPLFNASGGRFGSHALFYTWGDFSYNGMGPNQIALYRDSEISKYRQANFGRQIQFFPTK